MQLIQLKQEAILQMIQDKSEIVDHTLVTLANT